MGLVQSIFGTLFGGGRNALAETVQVFRPNAENQAQRSADYQASALAQLGAEFAHERKGWFDRLIDGLNRLPRPALALGTIGLLVSAMTDPIWFAERMQGLALVPDQLWWILGAIITFYFGARTQITGQNFQKSIAATMSLAPRVIENITSLRELTADSPGVADVGGDAELTLELTQPQEITADAVSAVDDPPSEFVSSGNAAVDDWRRSTLNHD